jgi:hypothetical protein
MELDARRHLDLPAGSMDTRRDQEFFGRIVPSGRPAGRTGSDAASRLLWPRDPRPAPMRASAPPAVKTALLVDTDVPGVAAVGAALQLVAHVEVCTDFVTARARLLQDPPDLLITNLRLKAYNGLHLVLLAGATHTRCIVFATQRDIGMARAVQAAGAFFELPARLPQVLESYVNATLPQHDRRDIAKMGQTLQYGRRCTDQ